MKKKLVVVLLSAAMCVAALGGCGSKAGSSSDSSKKTVENSSKEDDQKAADEVAKKIDAIYVQKRNDKTDEQCKEAKEAWDKLTDAQKELVEGEPEDTSCESVIAKVKDAGYKNVILRPLMVVAGDHANNDMAGDDNDSWKSQFEASKNFDSVKTQIAGLGEIDAIQQLYVAHTKAAMDAQ